MGNQAGRVVLFFRPDLAGRGRSQLPRDEFAVGAGQLAGGQCFADQGADALFVSRVGGEKYPQSDGLTVYLVGDIVRRQRARG